MKDGRERLLIALAIFATIVVLAFVVLYFASRSGVAHSSAGGASPSSMSRSDAELAAPQGALETREATAETQLVPTHDVDENAGAPEASSKFQEIEAELDRRAVEKGWDVKYQNSSVLELEQCAAEFEALIYEKTIDEFERLFAAGQYEVLSHSPVRDMSSNDFDPTEVYWINFQPSGPVQKMTLPRDEFPAVYELKAESAWLRGQIRSRAK